MPLNRKTLDALLEVDSEGEEELGESQSVDLQTRLTPLKHLSFLRRNLDFSLPGKPSYKQEEREKSRGGEESEHGRGKVVGRAVIIARQVGLGARRPICSTWQPGNQAQADPSRQESQGGNQMDNRQITGRGHCPDKSPSVLSK